jgi:hypothetical protein
VKHTDRLACTEGCCVVTVDRAYYKRSSGVARPMYQVLYDRAATSTGWVSELDDRAMHVPAREYERPGRWFL